jgi:hypothetical protein
MRNIDENNLIWESYSQSGIITSMKVEGDMVQLKGIPFPIDIDEIRVNSATGTVKIEQDEYKVSGRILKALMSMGAPNEEFDADYEEFRSGKAGLRDLEKRLENRPHDADDSDLDEDAEEKPKDSDESKKSEKKPKQNDDDDRRESSRWDMYYGHMKSYPQRR